MLPLLIGKRRALGPLGPLDFPSTTLGDRLADRLGDRLGDQFGDQLRERLGDQLGERGTLKQ